MGGLVIDHENEVKEEKPVDHVLVMRQTERNVPKLHFYLATGLPGCLTIEYADCDGDSRKVSRPAISLSVFTLEAVNREVMQ